MLEQGGPGIKKAYPKMNLPNAGSKEEIINNVIKVGHFKKKGFN